MDSIPREKLIKDYFVDIAVSTKITGESNETCEVEFVIDIDGFYLKTSFTAIKAKVEAWKRKHKNPWENV